MDLPRLQPAGLTSTPVMFIAWTNVEKLGVAARNSVAVCGGPITPLTTCRTPLAAASQEGSECGVSQLHCYGTNSLC